MPQTQRYCAGDFAHWDPKITTFPGLYVAGAGFGRALHAASRLLGRPLPPGAACGASALRGLNALLAGACFLVTRALALALHPRQGRDYAALLARPAHAAPGGAQAQVRLPVRIAALLRRPACPTCAARPPVARPALRPARP